MLKGFIEKPTSRILQVDGEEAETEETGGVLLPEEEIVEPEDPTETEEFEEPPGTDIIDNEELSSQVEDILEQQEEISEEQAEAAT
jgi:hypothetical protein